MYACTGLRGVGLDVANKTAREIDLVTRPERKGTIVGKVDY
jgi:hypothetical protein